MNPQIKVSQDIKREIEIFATLTQRTQAQLVADAWVEYRERHRAEFQNGLRWAETVLAEPEAAAAAASGMSPDLLDELDAAFTDPSGAPTVSASGPASPDEAGALHRDQASQGV